MVHFRSVEDAGNEDILRFEDFVLEDVLVEGYADVVGSREYTVRGCGQAEYARFLHILHNGYLLAGVVDFFVAVGADGYYAEYVASVAEAVHVEVVAYGRAFRGQRLAGRGGHLASYHIFAEQVPVGITLPLVLYAEGFQVEVRPVEIAERDGQFVAHAGVECGAREVHVDRRR